MPVDKDSMNYAAVVLVAMILYALIYWFAEDHRKIRTVIAVYCQYLIQLRNTSTGVALLLNFPKMY